MDAEYASETDSDYTSYWRDWVRAFLHFMSYEESPGIRSAAFHLLVKNIRVAFSQVTERF